MDAAAHAARSIFLRILSLFLVILVSACTTQSVMQTSVRPLQSEKYAAIVVDANTGRVLFEKNSRDARYPASLTKMMTLYLLFEALDAGRVSLDTQIPVSAYAAKRPPSKIGFKPGQTINVRSTILALAVRSANDVAAAVGEFLGGSEERFAAMMTAKARALGMQSTTFRNASGLPDEGQRTTAHDMAILGMALRRHFPHHYHYFSNREFTFAGKVIRGHNNLLGKVVGADGLKTGYIRASGFNLVTSVGRGGRRIVAVVMGGETAKSRDAHMEELIELYLPKATPAGV
ncbi:D-alanyl-D-alanine carboxypeptidase [Aminobacter sp. J15]|nr:MULTISPECIES: D-alanyl-D-alanine carboxypeptidase family protein [unclassified Aminobacter]TWH36319.1 D-alanyl-D-alanine carboxypeptidase [Aminobacter sp. J15]